MIHGYAQVVKLDGIGGFSGRPPAAPGCLVSNFFEGIGKPQSFKTPGKNFHSGAHRGTRTPTALRPQPSEDWMSADFIRRAKTTLG
jgi:hypothetical protein